MKTELYIIHPGLKTLIFDVITARTPEGEMMRAISAEVTPHKVRDFGKEKIGLYIIVPDKFSPKPIPGDEDGPFVMLGF